MCQVIEELDGDHPFRLGALCQKPPAPSPAASQEEDQAAGARPASSSRAHASNGGKVDDEPQQYGIQQQPSPEPSSAEVTGPVTAEHEERVVAKSSAQSRCGPCASVHTSCSRRAADQAWCLAYSRQALQGIQPADRPRVWRKKRQKKGGIPDLFWQAQQTAQQQRACMQPK